MKISLRAFAFLLCQGSTRRLSSRGHNPFPADPRTMAANVLVNVIRTVATEERVLFSRGREGKLARTQRVVSACGTRGSRLIRESLAGKSEGGRAEGDTVCVSCFKQRLWLASHGAFASNQRPTDVNWNRSIVRPCLSILLLLSFLSFFGEIRRVDWKDRSARGDRSRVFIMQILSLLFSFSFFFPFTNTDGGRETKL